MGGGRRPRQGPRVRHNPKEATGHAHPIDDPGHTHSTGSWGNATETTNPPTTRPLQGLRTTAFAGQLQINSSFTGIGVENNSAPAGTNAPYIALRVCQKSAGAPVSLRIALASGEPEAEQVPEPREHNHSAAQQRIGRGLHTSVLAP